MDRGTPVITEADLIGNATKKWTLGPHAAQRARVQAVPRWNGKRHRRPRKCNRTRCVEVHERLLPSEPKQGETKGGMDDPCGSGDDSKRSTMLSSILMPMRPWLRYRVGLPIAKGSYAMVYEGLDSHTQQPVAMKCFCACDELYGDHADDEVRTLERNTFAFSGSSSFGSISDGRRTAVGDHAANVLKVCIAACFMHESVGRQVHAFSDPFHHSAAAVGRASVPYRGRYPWGYFGGQHPHQ